MPSRRIYPAAVQHEGAQRGIGVGHGEDALAHRLQTVEQPSPILLVIEQAVDLPPVRRLRLLILAQDVIERVRGPHHGRPPQPSVWQIGPFKFSFNVG